VEAAGDPNKPLPIPAKEFPWFFLVPRRSTRSDKVAEYVTLLTLSHGGDFECQNKGYSKQIQFLW
jgi:hypothetical protein